MEEQSILQLEKTLYLQRLGLDDMDTCTEISQLSVSF